MKNYACNVMIGVSTRQNTTNLVPFIQFDGRKMILLETEKARQDGWSKGIAGVIKNRGKQVEICSIGEGDDIQEIIKKIEKCIKDINEPIWWNIGGGQKLQTMSLIRMFNERSRHGEHDLVCYSEPQSRKTSFIFYKDRALQNKWVETGCDLDAREIASTFNYKISKADILWERTPYGGRLFEEKILSKPDMDWFFDFEKRQEMFLYALQEHRNEQTKKPAEVFPKGFKKFADYFESLVQSICTKIAAADPASHRINEVWGNVHVVSESQGDTGQEFDVLLVTDFGTLISIDAKTYDFAKKEEDARKLNLDMVSGRYTDFWSVFPYMKRDLSDDSILQKEPLWNKLLQYPYKLERRGSNFMVLSESSEKPFYIENIKNKKIVPVDSTSKPEEAIELKPLEKFIDWLKLKK